MRRTLLWSVPALALTLLPMSQAGAGMVVYEDGDKMLEIGGRIQIQYLDWQTTGASATGPLGGDEKYDDIFIRRLRPYIAGTVTKDWYGKIQFDFGAAEDANEVAVKDAYMQYRGWKNHFVTIGNAKAPFSREFLTSSKRQQTIERTFGGEHNFASPDRALGVKLEGRQLDRKLVYMASIGVEDHDPGIHRLDFDTPVNRNTDFNEGLLTAARVDWHPLGYMPYDQGDFHTDHWLFTVSAAGYHWENDHDNNTYTDENGNAIDPDKADLDEATGVEVSGGVRGHGVSVDVEAQHINADTVDSTFTGGIYVNGGTDLDLFAIEGGYMLPGNHVELVAAWDTLDASSYQHAWERVHGGVNWFWNRHKAKIQVEYRHSKNFLGETGVKADALSSQVQFVF